MIRSHLRRPPGAAAVAGEGHGDAGFTLIELVIALMILAVVLASLAPAFYGMMKATVTTNQRSVADGIAVAATEQLRSLPYYEVGYSTSPDYCGGSNPVSLGYYTPVDDFAKTETVGTITYTIETCVYWVQAGTTGSTTYTDAYKQSVVRVLWGLGNRYTYTQSSAIYPGGESTYASPGQQNFPPSGGVSTPSGSAPATPTANSAVQDAEAPTSVIDVDWQPITVSSGTPQYVVEWWTGPTRPATPSATSPLNGTPDSSGGLEYQIAGLSAGVTYSFDVVATVSGSYSGPSNVVSTSTANAASTSCVINSINVTPSSPVIDTSGTPVDFTSLSITVQATESCGSLSVEYGLNGPSGYPDGTLTPVALSWNSGSFTGSASQSTWSASTYGFIVYNSSDPTSAQANVTPCQEKGTTGAC